MFCRSVQTVGGAGMLLINSDESLLPLMSDPKETTDLTIWAARYTRVLYSILTEREGETESILFRVQHRPGERHVPRDATCAEPKLAVARAGLVHSPHVVTRLDHATRLRALDERVDGLVDVLKRVRRRQLHADPRLALGHHLISKHSSGSVSKFQHCGLSVARTG
jgi:hypothetical protein